MLMCLFICLIMYDKALNVCSLGKRLVLFSLESQCFPRLRLGKHRDSWENKDLNATLSEQTVCLYPRGRDGELIGDTCIANLGDVKSGRADRNWHFSVL